MLLRHVYGPVFLLKNVKMLKYQPLIHALTVGGYSTKIVGLTYGSLGHVHRLCVRGLQIGLNNNSKQIAKYCSVSVCIYGEGAVISTHNITITIYLSLLIHLVVVT